MLTELDKAVLRLYQWEDIELDHDFYAQDYLPENDNIRFTISESARKEILKRLLQLNHELYDKEVEQGLHEKGKTKKKKKTVVQDKDGAVQTSMFDAIDENNSKEK